MKHLTKISMVGAFWLCKWEEASSIPPWNWSNSLLGVSHWWIKQLRRNFPRCSSPSHFLHPNSGGHLRVFVKMYYGWHCWSRCAWIFEMYQNSWYPNLLFQYVRCINSWCCFGTPALKTTSYWTTDNTIINARILKAKLWDQTPGRCQTLSRPSRPVHKKWGADCNRPKNREMRMHGGFFNPTVFFS